MTIGDALRLIQSKLPSQRMTGAQWLLENYAGGHEVELVQALEREQVPRIRRLLQIASSKETSRDDRRVPRSPASDVDSPQDASFDSSEVLNHLASLIRHETEPAIGWIRRSANLEIASFADSDTNRQIEALRRRITGLVMLAEANRAPRYERVSLASMLAECTPPDLAAGILRMESATDAHDTIATDRGLMTLILANALQNALDATSRLPAGPESVLATAGVSDESFWVTVSNRFSGTSFELEDIARVGASSKSQRRGLGVMAMQIAASRMGYTLNISAAGGVATFSLRGNRNHD